MSSLEVRAAVAARLAALFAAAPVFDDPNRLVTPPEPPAPFVVLEYLPGEETQASFGAPSANLFREEGTVQLHVFVPALEGSAGALALAEELRGIFRAQSFSGVSVGGVDPPLSGSGSGDGAWHRATVAFDYRFDRTA